MGGLIDMERKGCESIGCWTHDVNLKFDHVLDLDHVFLDLISMHENTSDITLVHGEHFSYLMISVTWGSRWYSRCSIKNVGVSAMAL